MSMILVLSGGTSSERAVSLRSGSAVATALEVAGHTVDIADPAQLLGDLKQYDAVFPALHGTSGEDGTIQAALEERKLAYVGSDSRVSALCFDKQAFKQLLQAEGLPIPVGEVVTLDDMQSSPLIQKPYVLKPIDDGSSIDTVIVRDPQRADTETILEIFSRRPQMLLEELVDGIEITVGVLDDKALPVIEIIPPESGEFDYENKYNGQSQELCPPLHVTVDQQAEAQRLALAAHRVAGCRDLSRTDMFVRPDGSIVILETNTLPGMTDQSLFPKAASVAGLSMEQLCDTLVRMALARAGK